jgi:hypothetical protein
VDSDEVLRAELKRANAECEQLRSENSALKSRLGDLPSDCARIERQHSSSEIKKAQPSAVTLVSRPELKVSLFRSLFRGRDDVYAVRWEGRNGRTGYSPAGIREWNPAPSVGQGKKRPITHSKLFPLTEEVVRDHLLGKQTIGVYPLFRTIPVGLLRWISTSGPGKPMPARFWKPSLRSKRSHVRVVPGAL